MNSTPHDTLDILGVGVDLVELPQVLDHMEQWIQQPCKQTHTIVVTGFHGLHVALEDTAFREIVTSADLFIPDGIAPVWIARRLGKKVAGRVTGTDLMRGYFELANTKGYSSYFFGDTGDTLNTLQNRLKQIYPGHRIAGMFSPPFGDTSEEDQTRMIDAINAAKPDVLWVGLGLPKQERWIHQNLHRLEVPIAIGVGAAFAFHAGTVKRVPEWIGNAGFEWVWRFLAEPRKLWRRDLIDGPRFLWTLAHRWPEIRKSNLPEAGCAP